MNNAQARLDLMKTWSPKRLEAALPTWARCKMLPAYRPPQLSQKLPNFLTRMLDPYQAERFAGLLSLSDKPARYIAEWNARGHYKPIDDSVEMREEALADISIQVETDDVPDYLRPLMDERDAA